MKRRSLGLVALTAASLVGCGSDSTQWIDISRVPTSQAPQDRRSCYSAASADRTVKRIICSGDPGIGVCFDGSGDRLLDLDDACIGARNAIEARFQVRF
jgi:hypothetical protein